MADWREGNDHKPARSTGRDKAKPVPPNPVVKQPESSAPVSAPGPKDWRGRQSRPTGSSPQTSKEWMRGENAPVVIRGVRRRVFLLLASIAIPLLIIAYINYLFRSPQRLPLFVLAPAEYASPELSEYPYSNLSPKFFGETNKDSIRLPQDAKASSQLLNEVLFSDDWTRKYLNEKFPRRNDKLLGGGPDHRVVSLYVSGFVNSVQAGDRVEVRLISPDANPFVEKSTDRPPAIAIGTVLKRIIDKIDDSAIVWVTLDVRPAPIVANFGDMRVPLKKYLESWFKDDLSNSERDRLVITLPGNDWEENWVSPELSSTVLGHVYRQCLSGQFDKKGLAFNSVTLAEAKRQINEKVDEWVRNHYHAIQEPQWIESDRTRAAADKLELISLVSHSEPAVPKQDSLSFASEYWTRLEKLREPYRFAPVELGMVEAQLIHLLELDEARSNVAIANIKTKLEAALKNLERVRPQPNRISLIEDRLSDEFTLADDSFSKLLATRYVQWRSNPPWENNIQPPDGTARASNTSSEQTVPADANKGVNKDLPAAASTDKNSPASGNARPNAAPQKLEDLSVDQRAHFIVYAFHQCSKDSESIDRFFNERALRWSLDSCGPTSNWLEVQFLKLLVQEVDWNDSANSAERSRACAAVWRLFCDMQQHAADPHPELAWWLRTDIQQVDVQLHKAVDLLIGENYSEALKTCRNTGDALAKLDKQSQLLTQALDLRDEVFWSTPHLLRWYLQLYRFHGNPGEIENKLGELGDVVALTHKLALTLKPTWTGDNTRALTDAKGHMIQEYTSELAKRFQAIEKARYDKIKELTGLAKPNPKTIRELRIALRTPFLDSTSRSSFVKALEDYFKAPLPGTDSERRENVEADTKIVQQEDLSPAISRFLTPLQSLESASYRTIFETMCNGDARYLLPTAKSLPSDSAQVLDRLYLDSLEARQLALSHGSHVSYWQDPKHDQDLPWFAPEQYLLVCQARHRQAQAERLAAAAWGDGEILNSTSPSSLFFYRLGTKYTQISSTNRLAAELLEAARKQLDETADRVLAVKLNFQNGSDSVSKNAKAHKITFRVESPSIARPTVYVSRERTPPVVGQDLRSKFLDVGADEQLFTLPADAEQIENQSLVLAFRGHYRSHFLKVESTRVVESVEIDFRRDEPRDPTLKVVHNSPQKTKVIVMLDCSESMTKFNVVNGMGRSVTAFVEAKRVTDEIIDALQNANESHNLELGLVLFGVRADESVMPEMKPENNQIRYSEVRRVDSDREYTNELRRIVRELEPDEHNAKHNITLGCTPLYDAIDCAVAMAQGANSLIYVVSDGYNEYVDFVTDEEGKKVRYYNGKMRNADVVKRRLGDQSILRVYQFSGPVTNRDESNQRKELKDLVGSRGKFFQSDRFSALESQIKLDLPRSEVIILNAANEELKRGTFGVDIGLDLKEKDLPLRVMVQATVSDISSDSITPKATKQQIVQLIGNEELVFEFKDGSSRLLPVPPTGFEAAIRNVVKLPLDTLTPEVDVQGGRDLQPVDVMLTPIYNAAREEKSQDQLSFKIRLQERNNQYCTPRPLLVLGSLSAAGQPTEHDYLISDFGMARAHYPVIQLPPHPWARDKRKRPLPANLTLWMAFDKVDFHNSVSLKDAEQKSVGSAVLKRDKRSVMVTLSQTNKKRIFVVCDKAANSHRVFDRPNLTETHTFQLYPSVGNQEVSIQLIELDELNNKNIQKLEFEAIPVVNLP